MIRTLASETLQRIGEQVTLMGWVDTIRDHGKIVFIELRDRSGKVQVVGDSKLGIVKPESVLEIQGTVAQRPENMVNSELPTGTVEVQAVSWKVLGQSKEIPFPLDTPGYDIAEELRLKYRYLDLRRERLQKNIKQRSEFVQRCRKFLFSQDFTEIETPLLTQSTPEGSRDFLVPARLQPGKFFALPQSPQQYKQLLMVAGFERYFQIAKCLRDEDLRADRGFEHTQLDMEMSFVTMEDVMNLVEAMFIEVFESFGKKLKHKPFARITYREAMATFGADKFDDRTDEEKAEGTLSFTWVTDFPFFEKTDDGNWTFTHNPFSMPKPEFIEDHLAGRNIESIITQQYDLVCNGYEVGGGSIRAHLPEILESTYRIMGYDKNSTLLSIGHMLQALSFGAPPHGGIAPGIDRLLMILTQEPAMREVVAFPQTSRGTTSVTNAPTEVTDQQLKELGIQVRSMKNASLESQSVFERIRTYLTNEGVAYKTFEHEPVYTSEQAAAVRNTPLEQGAKALVLKADTKPVMAVISAADKLDIKAFKKTYGLKDVSLADRELLKQITGLEPGAVPPFGSLFALQTYIDEKLTTMESMNFNAGSHTHSMQMRTKDFLAVEKPTIGSIAKSGS